MNSPQPRRRPISSAQRCPGRRASKPPARIPPSRLWPRSTNPMPPSRRSTSSSGGWAWTPALPTRTGAGCCANGKSWRPDARRPSASSVNSRPGCATSNKPNTSQPSRSTGSRSPRQPKPPAASKWKRDWRCAPPRNAPMPFADGRIRCVARLPRSGRRGCAPSRPASRVSTRRRWPPRSPMPGGGSPTG